MENEPNGGMYGPPDSFEWLNTEDPHLFEREYERLVGIAFEHPNAYYDHEKKHYYEINKSTIPHFLREYYGTIDQPAAELVTKILKETPEADVSKVFKVMRMFYVVALYPTTSDIFKSYYSFPVVRDYLLQMRKKKYDIHSNDDPDLDPMENWRTLRRRKMIEEKVVDIAEVKDKDKLDMARAEDALNEMLQKVIPGPKEKKGKKPKVPAAGPSTITLEELRDSLPPTSPGVSEAGYPGTALTAASKKLGNLFNVPPNEQDRAVREYINYLEEIAPYDPKIIPEAMEILREEIVHKRLPLETHRATELMRRLSKLKQLIGNPLAIGKQVKYDKVVIAPRQYR